MKNGKTMIKQKKLKQKKCETFYYEIKVKAINYLQMEFF